MKKFVFTLERMLAYQEQNLEKEKGILARITAERDKLEKYTEMLAQVKERMEGLGK